jgi:hypothetical protein
MTSVVKAVVGLKAYQAAYCLYLVYMHSGGLVGRCPAPQVLLSELRCYLFTNLAPATSPWLCPLSVRAWPPLGDEEVVMAVVMRLVALVRRLLVACDFLW